MENVPTTKPDVAAKIGAATFFGLLVISGVYKIGYEAGRVEVAEEMNREVSEWKEKAEEINTVIVTEYTDRTKEVVRWRTKNVEVVKLVPSACELSDGWVHVHDRSAEGRDADPARAINDTPSGIEDVEAVGTVIENYATCHETREQLVALQSWITEHQELINTTDTPSKQEE